MLDRLIRYLRATLGASRTGLHPLADEFDRLADYLALMALRMGPRLQVLLSLPADLRGLPVPPLLLQPLVENSIRHGLEPKIEGGRIEVRAEQRGEHLLLTVRDTGVGLDQAGTPHSMATTPKRRRTATTVPGMWPNAWPRSTVRGRCSACCRPMTPRAARWPRSACPARRQ